MVVGLNGFGHFGETTETKGKHHLPSSPISPDFATNTIAPMHPIGDTFVKATEPKAPQKKPGLFKRFSSEIIKVGVNIGASVIGASIGATFGPHGAVVGAMVAAGLASGGLSIWEQRRHGQPVDTGRVLIDTALGGVFAGLPMGRLTGTFARKMGLRSVANAMEGTASTLGKRVIGGALEGSIGGAAFGVVNAGVTDAYGQSSQGKPIDVKQSIQTGVDAFLPSLLSGAAFGGLFGGIFKTGKPGKLEKQPENHTPESPIKTQSNATEVIVNPSTDGTSSVKANIKPTTNESPATPTANKPAAKEAPVNPAANKVGDVSQDPLYNWLEEAQKVIKQNPEKDWPSGITIVTGPNSQSPAASTKPTKLAPSPAVEGVIHQGTKAKIKSTIRSSQELTPAQVSDILNAQLVSIEPKDLKRILAKIPAQDRAQALEAIQQMSHFGNMRSLESLNNVLAKYADEGYQVLTLGDANLSTTMKYFGHHKELFKNKVAYFTFNGDQVLPGSSRVLLVDKATVSYLKKNPDIVQQLQRSGNLKLLIPQGWDEGLSLFNHGHFEGKAQFSVETKINHVFEQAKRLQQAENISLQEAVDKVMHQPLLDELKELGLDTHHTEIVKNPKIGLDAPTVESVSGQFRDVTISPQQVEELLVKLRDQHHFPEDYQQAVLELLANSSSVYSPQALSLSSQAIHRNILDLAKQRGIPEDQIYYYIASNNKSYGTVGMIHQMTNGINPNRITSQLSEIPDNALVVALDDVAGGGTSLQGIVDLITNNRKIPQSNVVVAPLVSSVKATNYLFEKFPEISYVPGDILPGFKESLYYTGLPEHQKAIFEQILGGSGFGSLSMSTAFPYMAPDNNSGLFSQLIAPWFTHNGRAVKKESWEIALPKPASSASSASSMPGYIQAIYL